MIAGLVTWIDYLSIQAAKSSLQQKISSALGRILEFRFIYLPHFEHKLLTKFLT